MDNVRAVKIRRGRARDGYYCLLTIYRGDDQEPTSTEMTKPFNDPRLAYAAARLRQIELMGVSRG